MLAILARALLAMRDLMINSKGAKMEIPTMILRKCLTTDQDLDKKCKLKAQMLTSIWK